MLSSKLGAIGALLVGAVILVMGLMDTAEKKKIDREGIETTAIATAKSDHRGRKGSHTYKLDIVFPGKEGGKHTAKVEVPREIYDKIDDNHPLLKIKYLESLPGKAIVVGQPLEAAGMLLVGGVVLLVGAFGTWKNFFRN